MSAPTYDKLGRYVPKTNGTAGNSSAPAATDMLTAEIATNSFTGAGYIKKEDASVVLLGADARSIQGRSMASTAPTNGQAVVWNNTNNRWEPGTVSLSAAAPVLTMFTGNGSTSLVPISGYTDSSQVNYLVVVGGVIQRPESGTYTVSASGVQLSAAPANGVPVFVLAYQAPVSVGSFVSKAGDTMTGPLVLPGNAGSALHAVPRQQLDAATSGLQTALGFTPLNKAGDTMTGLLVLSGNASAALNPITKQQFDAAVAGLQTALGFTPLNKAGDSMTGTLGVKAVLDTVTTVAPVSGVVTLDLSLGQEFLVNLTANVTSFTLTNTPSGAFSFSVSMKQDTTGGRTVAWTFTGKTLLWQAAAAPTVTSIANKEDEYAFKSRDSGATFKGYVAGQNF